jgi:RNA polymerase sigma factor (TIGR02999 family)
VFSYGFLVRAVIERLPRSHVFTALLSQWRAGDAEAGRALADEVYPLMKEISAAQLRRSPGLAVQTTELANEAYLRLVEIHAVDWQDRRHFMAIVATVIRRLLVDLVRERAALKRGGAMHVVSLDEPGHRDSAVDPRGVIDCSSIERALSALESCDADAARVAELKVLVGMSVQDIADEMASSTATVGRQWRFAKAFLADRLRDAADFA